MLIAIFLAGTTPIFGQQEVMNHLIAAREYLNADSDRLAKIELDSALLISPKNSMANALMGDLMNKRGALQKALLSYDKAIIANPNDADLYIKRAELHIKLNNHRLYILNDYNRAINLVPTKKEYYLKKARYLARTVGTETSPEDFEAAAETLSQVIAFTKDDDELYFLRSKYNFGAQHALAALADINKAIELSPTNDGYLAQRGYINFMLNKYRASYADYTKAIKLNNTLARYYAFRGHTNYNLEKYLEAYDDYSIAIDLIISKIASKKIRISNDDPLNKELRNILLYRGMSLVQDNRPYDGCDDFERAYLMGESKARNYIRKYCN